MSSRLRTIVITLSTLVVALLLMGAVLARSSSNEGAYRELGVYTDVLSRIKSDYVEEPDLKSVTLGAINGLLESVDPFASYLNAEQYKEYLKNKDAYKGSVGLILSKRFGYVGVVDAIPGSPAAKAGLTTGDRLRAFAASRRATCRSPMQACCLKASQGPRLRFPFSPCGTPSRKSLR